MNNNAHTISNSGKITAIINGEVYTIDPSHPKYNEGIEAIRNLDYDSFVEAIDITRKVKSYIFSTDLKIEDGVVIFKNEEIHNAVTKKIIDFMQKDLPVAPLFRFLENLLNNPSKRSVDELMNFLDVGELPLTEDGHFLAFKNVKSDYKDIHSGTFDNSVGKTCEMPRWKVDDEKDRTCSTGLHFCSINYLPNFSDSCGGHTMIVKINPADVVSIPADYNNTKGRCCKYVVVGEYTENWREKIGRGENGWDSPLYDEDGNEWEDEDEDDICDNCGEDLTPANYEENGDELCNTCYDDKYSGCCGGGCHSETSSYNEDEKEPTFNDYLDKKCDYTHTEDDAPVTPTPTPYHNVRDEKGRFSKKQIIDAITSLFNNKED